MRNNDSIGSKDRVCFLAERMNKLFVSRTKHSLTTTKLLCQIHHIMIISICLIKLHTGNSGLCLVLIPSFLNIFPSPYTQGNPPITNRFKCNSVAILNVKFISMLLWYVSNGLASAPPGWVCKTGVSISKNPLASNWRRRLDVILARLMNFFPVWTFLFIFWYVPHVQYFYVGTQKEKTPCYIWHC